MALASLYGNFKGQRLLLDSKIANLAFVWFVGIFFAFGLARMALVSGYAGTDKEKAFREWTARTEAAKHNVSAKTN